MFDTKKSKENRLSHLFDDSISKRSYNFIIGLMTLYGLGLATGVGAIVGLSIPKEMLFGWSTVILGIVVLLLSMVGSFIMGTCSVTGNSILSFIGYHLVVVPLGAFAGIAIVQYSLPSIIMALIGTIVVTFSMLILATIKPDLFSGLGKTLFISLLVGLLTEIVFMLFGYHSPLFDWFFVVIFALYVGFDWHKAQEYPKTVCYAIISSTDLFLDIINIFIRLLSIIGNRSSRK